MPASFTLKFSAFSVLWLRAYDFGLDEEHLIHTVEYLKQCPLVKTFRRIAVPGEIDEVDGHMFDIRYQERSQLVRVHFQPFDLVDHDLGIGRQRAAAIAVSLLLDLGSGFGVFSVCLPRPNEQGDNAFTVEELGYLTRQWLLPQDDQGRPQRLTVRLPSSEQVVPLYVREAINFYFLQTHSLLWKTAKPETRSPLQEVSDFKDWLKMSRETDPVGCATIQELYRTGLTRSLFPTSFGPLVDVWSMEGVDPSSFDANTFGNQYEAELAWLFTDGRRTTLGEQVKNQRSAKSLALYVWPNHALYINQHPASIDADRVHRRVEQYGCLDVEIARILEILNLQSALLHAFDSFLDQQLERVSTLAASDQEAVIQLTERRRKMSRSTRSFDFYNLFHTAYWELLYARLLEHPHLRLHEVIKLVDMKLTRLDEAIRQAIIIQDQTRQQQQREQELDVLRGLHNLSLANDVQSNALLAINFLVSATASFSFTEVLAPWLTSLTGAQPSFPDAYPLLWLGINVGVFSLVAMILTITSSSMIRRGNRMIELGGRLDLPLDVNRLQSYYAQHRNLAYLHLDADDLSGYIRIRIPSGTLVFEFDRERIFRYSVLLQGRTMLDPEQIRQIRVEEEIRILYNNHVIKQA